VVGRAADLRVLVWRIGGFFVLGGENLQVKSTNILQLKMVFCRLKSRVFLTLTIRN